MKTLRILGLVLAPLAMAGGARAQCQSQKVVPSDTGCGDAFGYSCAIDGEWAAVGAYGDDDVASQSGAVYVHQRVGSSWIEKQKLKANDAGDGHVFGYSVAISGDTLVVGAHSANAPGANNAGAAYVFELAGATWSQTAKLVASDPQFNDLFGASVAVYGTRVLVGADDEDQLGLDAGAVYAFDKIGGSWVQTQKLLPSDGNPGDAFGKSVGVSGDFALIGASCKEGPAGNCQGAAYVFENVAGTWIQRQKLVANDPGPGEGFGLSVAIRGDVAVVGAPGHNHPGMNFHGGVYLYERSGPTWVLQTELLPNDSADVFGLVALSPEHVIVGAPGDNDNLQSGSAFDFREIGSTWTQVGKLMANDAEMPVVFGFSVGVSGETAIVGAWADDDADPPNIGCNSGSAYVFELAPTARQYGHCPTGAPCVNWDDHGGCRNSTGKGAVLSACGSGGVAADDLRLELNWCPPNKLTLLFMGPGQAPLAYGDGIRVVSGQPPVGVYRYGGAAADAQGHLVRGPGLVGYSQGFAPLGRIQAGQTWNFQYWYRDPMGPCGGLTNFSNGVEVAFGP